MINFSLSILIVAISQLSIILLGLAVYKNRNNLVNPSFKQRYGSLVEGLTMKGFHGKFWNVYFLVRWSITSFILVILSDYYGIQILVLLMLSVMSSAFIIIGHPLEGRNENMFSLANEFLV